LVFVDTTLAEAGNMLGYHSAFWDLPTSVTSIPTQSPTELKSSVEAEGARTIRNGYLGPCPGGSNPPPPHTYAFTLYAMPEATTEVPGSPMGLTPEIIEIFEAAALAKVELTGTSSASMGGGGF
jgi:phosphatidylethanolamine-binding protein (PEBP) family uncharacterized protein